MDAIGVLRLPQTISFGYGVRDSLTSVVRGYGTRAFVVVDPFLAGSEEFRSAMASFAAAGVETLTHDSVEPELPVGSLQDDAETARGFAPHAIVAWGGGSAIDAAKAIALLVAHGGALADYYGENQVPGPILPLIVVPTTAGTGSEVTPVAVLTDAERELKVGISSPELVPAVAIVDPELTLGVPERVTAYSGIDALVHAIESYTAGALGSGADALTPVFIGRNALTEPLSLEAARLIGSSIETAVAEPGNREAREAMARGSLLAGMAFGSTGTHLSHAIQYPLGALTHTPHGLGTGLMLPYVLEACAAAVPERLARIGEALGVEATPEAAIERVVEILAGIGIPTSLSEIGVAENDIERIAELTLASARLTAIAPIPVDLDQITRILRAAYAGDRTLLRHQA